MDNKRERASAFDVHTNSQHLDAFIRYQFREVVQFLRARTASEQDAEVVA
jgi:hypothetical protein